MKKLSILMFAILASTTLLNSCDDVDVTEQATKAANDFCNCYQRNTLETCEKRFFKEYGDQPSSEFIDAFNLVAKKCGVKLKREYYNSRSMISELP